MKQVVRRLCKLNCKQQYARFLNLARSISILFIMSITPRCSPLVFAMEPGTDHSDPPLHLSLLGDVVPDTAPHSPSPVEARYFYYGIPSQPRLVARSSTDVWVEPTGPEAYLVPKEASPLGLIHRLQEIWEATVGPAMVAYLDSKGVSWTSLDPIRMGDAGDSSPPAIVWMGVIPSSLTAEMGIEVVTHCKRILSAHGIDDVHIQIREAEVHRLAKLYKPVPTSNTIVRVLEPFSTALGLPISTEATPSIGGTGGFFITDPSNPGKFYLVTARHVVINPNEDNELYQYTNTSQPLKNVLLFSNPAIEKHIDAIKSEMDSMKTVTEQLERRLEFAEKLEEEAAEAERDEVQPQLKKAQKAVGDLRTFLADVSRDWKEPKSRVLGHVILSPPITFNEEEGFTEDWAVIEMDKSNLDSTNFIGNAIDLGIDITVRDFTDWMYPHHTNPPSFKYPGDRLLKFHGTISDKEMYQPHPKTCDHHNDPVIMVIKRGHGSGLTVGRLNTVRSFLRYYFKGKPGQMSREVAVLPRNSQSGPFSRPGDSGSCVIDGKGRLAGLLTGGSGSSDVSDCTYVTSINFICQRMLGHDLKANIFPSIDT